MINIFQMSSSVYHISICLGIALIITTTAALNMVEKKRLSLFMPFFMWGLGLCLTAGFMFYDFFGIAVDVFYVFSFVVVFGVFFNLWGAGK